MAKSITIRNVPDPVRNELAARAASGGQSLQEYLLGQLVALIRKPTPDSLARRIAARKQANPVKVSAKRILSMRDADRG